MAFIDEFADMLADTVTVQPGVTDGEGAFIASGATLSIPARIEGRTKLVRPGVDSQQVVSSVQLYLGGVYDLTTDRHRYTIPTRYYPYADITAVSVERVTDEEGPVNEVVYLP